MAFCRVVLIAVAGLVAGCAGRRETAASSATVSVLSSADSARCAALADSVRAATPPEALPFATPIGRPAMPRAPRDVPVGTPLRTVFLVGPDGRADTSSVWVTGTGDARYRSEMVHMLARRRFRPAVVAGCPSWGRGDIVMVGVPGSTRSP